MQNNIDKSDKTATDLIAALADILMSPYSGGDKVLGLDVESYLKLVRELFIKRIGSSPVKETGTVIAQVVLDLEPLTDAWLKAQGKNPGSLAKWVVFARGVEYVGESLRDMLEYYKENTTKVKPTDEQV